MTVTTTITETWHCNNCGKVESKENIDHLLRQITPEGWRSVELSIKGGEYGDHNQHACSDKCYKNLMMVLLEKILEAQLAAE